ncbi:MAG: cysteine-rich KTR domain-containing protein [bacterium]|nr:cysteine-rich KTR domain-containing protein [bacterium]
MLARKESYWQACPKCGYPHFIKKYRDTVLINFPAYCKGCKTEINISTKSREPKPELAI